MFTVFEYCYRDASNFKAFGEVWLDRELSSAEQAQIVSKMETEEFFIAEQVGLAPLYEELEQYSNGPTEADHAWHSFIEFQKISEQEVQNAGKKLARTRDFYKRFSSIEKWRPQLSKNFA